MSKPSAVEILKRLVDKLGVILEADEYKTVFLEAHVHGVRYTGPTFEHELKDARAFLEAEGKGECSCETCEAVEWATENEYIDRHGSNIAAMLECIAALKSALEGGQ